MAFSSRDKSSAGESGKGKRKAEEHVADKSLITNKLFKNKLTTPFTKKNGSGLILEEKDISKHRTQGSHHHGSITQVSDIKYSLSASRSQEDSLMGVDEAAVGSAIVAGNSPLTIPDNSDNESESESESVSVSDNSPFGENAKCSSDTKIKHLLPSRVLEAISSMVTSSTTVSISTTVSSSTVSRSTRVGTPLPSSYPAHDLVFAKPSLPQNLPNRQSDQPGLNRKSSIS